MTRPSTKIRRTAVPLVMALGVTGAAIAGVSVEAGENGEPPDTTDTQEPVDSIDVPDPSQPPATPLAGAREDDDIPPEPTIVDPGLPSTFLDVVQVTCEANGESQVAWSITNRENGGSTIFYTSAVEGFEDRAVFQDTVADGGGVVRAVNLGIVPAGEYKVYAFAYEGDTPIPKFVEFFIVGQCPPPPADTEPPVPTEPAPDTEPSTPTQPGPDTTVETSVPTSDSDAADAVSDTDAATAAAGGTLGEAVVGSSVGNVFRFADTDTPIGESTLIRTSDGVLATIWIGSLPPGEAVTLWWVVSNQPANCSPPGCGADDIFINGDPTQGLNDDAIDAAGVVAGYATGTLVAADGTMFAVARIDEGTPGVDVIVGDPDQPMLADAATAEIHLVARSHGPAIAGLEAMQTTSYAGGCDTMLNPPAQPAAPGQCADIAFAVHQP